MSYEYKPSTRKDKQLMVDVKGKTIHFGNPNMPEYPGTKRGDNYCTRSFYIKANGEFTRDNPLSPNYHSRRKLWNCEGKRSMK